MVIDNKNPTKTTQKDGIVKHGNTDHDGRPNEILQWSKLADREKNLKTIFIMSWIAQLGDP